MSKHIILTITGVDRLDKMLMERLGNACKHILYDCGIKYEDVIVEELIVDLELIDR